MISDADLLDNLRRAMTVGLPACREEIAKAAVEGREPCRIAVEMLPFWEIVAAHIDTNPQELLKTLREIQAKDRS